MVDTFIEVCVKIVGLLLVIFMIIGLFIAILMALTLFDYVFNTDLKQSLVNKMPHWSVLYKLRQHMIAKIDRIDQAIIAQDISNQLDPSKHNEIIEKLIGIPEEYPILKEDISAITNKSNSEAAQKHES